MEPSDDEVADGWRGLVDFGEVWSPSDAGLWPHGSDVPTGEALTYGCEVRFIGPRTEARVVLRLWAIDAPRPVMQQGAEFILRDGLTPRGKGNLLAEP